MLRNEPPERQSAIISRVWSAIGIKSGSVTDEMFGEWTEALADFELDDIERGVHFWKAKGTTCPADEFAESCKPQTSDPLTVKAQMAKLFVSDDSGMTFEEHYDFLGLPRRWGPLPANHPEKP